MIDDFDMNTNSYQFDECRRFIQSFFISLDFESFKYALNFYNEFLNEYIKSGCESNELIYKFEVLFSKRLLKDFKYYIFSRR